VLCSDSAALEHSAEARDAELCASLLCVRARCAWALKQHTLARSLLGRASDAAARVAAVSPGAAAAAAAERLATVYFECGRALLGADDTAASAAPLLQAAHEHASAAHAAASGAGAGAAAAARLCFKTLQCLAVAHLKAGAHELALNCARTLATQAASLAPPPPNTPAEGEPPAPPSGLAAAAATAARAAQFLCINALCGLRRVDEAVDALAAVADSAASAAASSADLLCDSAACVLRAGRPDAAASAVGALMAAAPAAGAAPALRFLEAALSDADSRPAALALLSSEAAAAALKGDGSAPSRKRLAHLQALLWNGATALFEAKDCACLCCMLRTRHMRMSPLCAADSRCRFLPSDSGARALFSAASSYAASGDPNRARAARAACLCLLALREPAEALRYIDLADQLEHAGSGDAASGAAAATPSVQTKFLKMKCVAACVRGLQPCGFWLNERADVTFMFCSCAGCFWSRATMRRARWRRCTASRTAPTSTSTSSTSLRWCART
jgi:hypothetical protein